MSEDKKNKDLTQLFNIKDFEHIEDPEAEAYFSSQQEFSPTDENNDENEGDDEPYDFDQEDHLHEEDDHFQEEFESEQLATSSPDSSFEDENLEEKEEKESSFEDFSHDEPELEEEDTFSDSSLSETPSLKEEEDEWAEDSPGEDFFSEDDSEDDGLDFFNDQPEKEQTTPSPSPDSTFESEDLTEEEEKKTTSPPITPPIKKASSHTHNQTTIKPQEKFHDIQKFVENTSYGKIHSKGTPPFSMVISQIQFQEDANRILGILREYGFINKANEKIIENGLKRGSTIISRVSEFALIFLYHKLHPLSISLTVGPSDELSQGQANDHDHLTQGGQVHAAHLLQNKQDSQQYYPDHIQSVLFTSQSQLAGYELQDFLGHCMVSDIVEIYPLSGELTQSPESLKTREKFKKLKTELINQLKIQVINKEGNAGVDFHIQITPLFNKEHQTFHYEITVSCNAVWAQKSSF